MRDSKGSGLFRVWANWTRLSPTLQRALVFMMAFAIVGVSLLFVSRAATSTASIEAEDGAASNCASAVADTTASNSGAVKFGGAGCDAAPSADAGAQLPITYNLSSLGGTVRYVATSGSDTATGTVTAPYATLSKAISASASGDSIVVRGGTYRNQGSVVVPSSKTLKIMAYPGETPIFNGAQTVSGNWTTDGSLDYIAYTPQPVVDGGGITFSTGQNLNGDGVGKYPDQAWIGSQQLEQVSTQAEVTSGKFWVDETNNRLYLSPTDAAKSNIEVSNKVGFLTIQSSSSDVEGLEITRYSSNGATAVVVINGTATHVTLRNLSISESAFAAINISVPLIAPSPPTHCLII